MSALTSCFSQLLSLALLALPVMAVVLLARQLLAKAPKKYSYALWFAVWFRLACPPGLLGRLRFSLFSLRPLAPVTQAAERLDRSLAAARSAPAVPVVSPPAAPAPDLGSAALPAAPGLSAGELALEIAALVWLAGLAVLVVWGLFSWLRLRRQVSAAVREEGEVWACDGISTPFTLGLLRPRVYVPFHLAGRERTYVLVHERFHIRHRDHWVKPLVLLLLAAYWWDPAVWLCWALFCRDMEMRCDEAVLETLGDQAKAGYSASLVAFALDRPTPTALAFGEHDAGCRVKHVLQWKQARPRIAFLAVAVVAAVLIACCSNGLAGAESWMRLEESASVGGFQQLRFTY